MCYPAINTEEAQLDIASVGDNDLSEEEEMSMHLRALEFLNNLFETEFQFQNQ